MSQSQLGSRRHGRAYFDHAATSPLRPEALAAMSEPVPGNPGAIHGSGRAARALLEDAREEIASLLGVAPLEVVLTSGGTEADMVGVMGAVRHGHALISAVEHPAVGTVTSPWLLGTRAGVLPVDQTGIVDPDSIAVSPLSKDLDVVSVMTVNNETGACQPVPQIAEKAHEAGALMHTDAVQALGHIPVDLDGWGVDLASFSAHKIGGPVGIGALWIRRGVEVHPVSPGGGQQFAIRSGTQPVALARGFAAALRACIAQFDEQTAQWQVWRERIVESCRLIPGVSVDDAATTSPTIIHLSVDRARGTDIVTLADRDGVDLSAGSACHAGVSRPSPTMLAMGRSDVEASSGVRISMGYTTTQADVDRLLAVLPAVIAQASGAR
ncbi:cysteine desulfurase family protein [Cutibacterium equinum]|uniref:cysteine desulfurase n=1 Tax=Cutibacterium equinum TaxID=3016342 RepID=A0ABY7R0K3_9ACTN|nr:cysteine desulfurase family protein [Cutibacterium equinum]WCC80828.1 cysteine desulfurase family protein [Cutibacterium equinum]